MIDTLKNILLQSLVRIFAFCSRNKQKGACHKILILSTTGLGDTLWATPALSILRSHLPSAYIVAITSPFGVEILENNPHIDQCIVLKKSWIPLYFRLNRHAFDTALIFHTSQRMASVFCHLLKIPEIIGFEKEHKGLDSFLTKLLKKGGEHEIEKRVRLVSCLGAHSTDRSMEVFTSSQHEDKASLYLQTAGYCKEKPLVGLHPGSKDPFKRWHAEGFIYVGTRLAKELNCQIIVTGSKEETPLVKHVASSIPGAFSLEKPFSVLELAALQKHMDLFITNDTGPMHLAAAVKTPLLALFGPTNPSLCGPLGSGPIHSISAPPACTPRLRKKCRAPFCLLQIGDLQVYTAAKKLLGK